MNKKQMQTIIEDLNSCDDKWLEAMRKRDLTTGRSAKEYDKLTAVYDSYFDGIISVLNTLGYELVLEDGGYKIIEKVDKEMKYIIRDRESGNVITWFPTMAEAVAEVAAYEAEDKNDGTYTEDFYEIVLGGKDVSEI